MTWHDPRLTETSVFRSFIGTKYRVPHYPYSRTDIALAARVTMWHAALSRLLLRADKLSTWRRVGGVRHSSSSSSMDSGLSWPSCSLCGVTFPQGRSIQHSLYQGLGSDSYSCTPLGSHEVRAPEIRQIPLRIGPNPPDTRAAGSWTRATCSIGLGRQQTSNAQGPVPNLEVVSEALASR